MNMLRNNKWIEDLEILALELPKKHKNLFFKKYPRDYFNEIQVLKSNVDYYDDYEIMTKIAEIIAAIGDAHTFVTLPIKFLWPLQFYWFSNGIYFTRASEEYDHVKYCKVMKINNIDIGTVIKELCKIISYENEYFLKSQLPKYLPAVELLYGLEIIDEISEVDIDFIDTQGEEQKVKIKPLPLKEAIERLEFNENQQEESSNLPLYRKNSDKNYWFQFLDDSKTVYFKYNLCRDMEDKSLFDFSKELKEFIDNNIVYKLIIDLRNNSGGDSTLLEPFIQDIKLCHKINREGRLFIIIGRDTFSSALLNAISLKKQTKGIFIGEPTGGKPNCYGEVEKFKLKNSGLQITYSTKYYRAIEDDSMLSLFPDKIIDTDIEDYINNVDPCVGYILENYNRV